MAESHLINIKRRRCLAHDCEATLQGLRRLSFHDGYNIINVLKTDTSPKNQLIAQITLIADMVSSSAIGGKS